MYKNLLNLLVLAVLLPSCSGTAPHISVVCEENNVGNCIVKWEMAPLIKGNIKVYASTDPDFIPEDVPVAMADISDLKMTIVTNDPTKRYYYTFCSTTNIVLRLPRATSTFPVYRTSVIWAAILLIPPRNRCAGE